MLYFILKFWPRQQEIKETRNFILITRGNITTCKLKQKLPGGGGSTHKVETACSPKWVQPELLFKETLFQKIKKQRNKKQPPEILLQITERITFF